MRRAPGLLLALLLCFAAPARAAEVSALFLGNSFTYFNDLPRTLSDLAASLGDRVVVASYAPGGYTLAQHASDPRALKMIRGKSWDFVVLQEQSQRPSFDAAQVAAEVLPAAARLTELVRDSGSKRRIVFFETWGRRDGDASNCKQMPAVCTYAGMQQRLTATYQDLARRHDALLAPVGEAWAAVRAAHPDLNLYAPEGVHPSPEGTYLAACVFYAALFKKSPVGAAPLYVSGERAAILQRAAAASALPQSRP